MLSEKTIIKEMSEIYGFEPEDFNITRNGHIMAEVEANGEQYTVYETYDDAEYAAKDSLIDSKELWKIAVENDATTDGLEDWAQTVVDCDGIITLCPYDGDFEEGKDYIYIRQN